MATAAENGATLNKRQMVEALFGAGKTTVADIIAGMAETYKVSVSANYVDTLLREAKKGAKKAARKAAKKGTKVLEPGSMTKGAMVRALLSAGITASADVVSQVKGKWGVDVSPGYVDSLRSKMGRAEKGTSSTEAIVPDSESKKSLIIALYRSGVKEPAAIVEALAAKHNTTATVTYVYKILGQHRKDTGAAQPRGRRRTADAEFEDTTSTSKRGRKPRQESLLGMTIEQARGILQQAPQQARAISEALVSQFGLDTINRILTAIGTRNNAVIGHVA